MTTRHRRTAGSALLALALVTTGCASSGREVEGADAGFGGESQAEVQEAQLTAENQNFSDATLYAVWGAGTRQRLGMVTGLTSQTFKMNLRGSGELRLEVDFIAGGNFTSDRVFVNPGDHVHITIPPA
jgi:hypothetical protein